MGLALPVVFVVSEVFSGSTILGSYLGQAPNSLFLGETAQLRRKARGRWKVRTEEACAICVRRGNGPCPVWSAERIEQIRALPEHEIIGKIPGILNVTPAFAVDASKSYQWVLSQTKGEVTSVVAHISKSPHEFAASIRRRLQAQSGSSMRSKALAQWRTNLSVISARWYETNLRLLGLEQASRVKRQAVRYEDFVRDPDIVRSQLLGTLGISTRGPPAPTTDRHYINGNPGVADALAASGNAEIRLILDERWRTELMSTDMRTIYADRRVRMLAERLGHDVPVASTGSYSFCFAVARQVSEQRRRSLWHA